MCPILINNHKSTFEVAGFLNAPSNALNYDYLTTLVRQQDGTQTGGDVYFPTIRHVVPMRHDGFEAPGSPISCFQHSSDSEPSARSLWLHNHAENGLWTHLAPLQSEVFVRCGTPVSPDRLPHVKPNIYCFCFQDKNTNNRYYTQQKKAEHYSLTPPPPFVFDPFGLDDYSSSSVLHGDNSAARIPGRDDDPIVPRNFAERYPPVEPIAPPSNLKVLDEDWSWIQHWANDVYKAMMDDE